MPDRATPYSQRSSGPGIGGRGKAWTLAEIAQHRKAEDCWMVIHGAAYELTTYLRQHPTHLVVILSWCGKDAREAYHTKARGRPHSSRTDQLLSTFLVGKLRSVNRVNNFLNETKVHLAFQLSLWCKGAFALSEIVAGVATYFVPPQLLLTLVLWVTKREFVEDPQDLVANFLLRAVQHLPAGTEKFAAIYLLGHGVIKLWLIAGLLRERLWFYPAAMSIFGLFIAYQLYRYTFTRSMWLLLVTALDVVVIALTWHEYRYIENKRKLTKSRPFR